MRALICLVAAGAALGQQVPSRARSANNTYLIREGRSYLGVAVVELDKGRGVEVKYVEEGSPAAKAGIKADDVVLEFNGRPVEGTVQFVRLVSETIPGTKAAVSIMRSGAPLTLSVVVGRQNMANIVMPPFPPMPAVPPTVEMPDLPRPTMFWKTGMLGIESESLNPQMAQYFGVKEGVLVRMVSRQSPAEKAGLKAGDVILRAAGKPVATTHDVTLLLRDRKSITLGVVRNRKELQIDVNLDGS